MHFGINSSRPPSLIDPELHTRRAMYRSSLGCTSRTLPSLQRIPKYASGVLGTDEYGLELSSATRIHETAEGIVTASSTCPFAVLPIVHSIVHSIVVLIPPFFVKISARPCLRLLPIQNHLLVPPGSTSDRQVFMSGWAGGGVGGIGYRSP